MLQRTDKQQPVYCSKCEITDNFDDILGDDQIQGIALATPAETHADLAIQAMRAGKDVFVEKPMALSMEDAEKMQKVANETGSHSYGWSFIGISSCGSQTYEN